MNDSTLDIKAFLDKDEQKDLLRLLTAGSVDDGKSTLIGRLLFDSKKLYEDQLDALERDSKRMEIKQLIAQLKKVNPSVEANIFRSMENVNLNTVISYKQGDQVHSFLDRYDEIQAKE